MAWLGATSAIWSGQPGDSVQPILPWYSNTGIDAGVSSINNPHDRGKGWAFSQLQGTLWPNMWTAPTGTLWYYFATAFSSTDNNANPDVWTWFYSHWNAAASPGTGRMRIEVQDVNTTTVKLAIARWDGSAWVTVSGFSGNISVNTTVHYFRWEIAASSTTLTIDNGSITGCTASVTREASLPGTPSIQIAKVSGKDAGAALTVDMFEIFAQDASGNAPTTAQTYTSASTSYHVFSATAAKNGDVAGGVWTPTNTPASCPSQKWVCIDDAHDANDQAGDLISCAATAGNKDQLFETQDDIDIASPAPDWATIGVQTYATGWDTSTQPGDYILHEVTSGAEAVAAQAGTSWVGGGILGGRTGTMLTKTPGGNAWTEARWNSLRAGVRESRTQVAKCGTLLIMVIGTNLQRPAQNAACDGFAYSQAVII